MKQYGIRTHACSKNKRLRACAPTQLHDFWISISISQSLRSSHTVVLHARSTEARGIRGLFVWNYRYRTWMSIIEDDVVERPLNPQKETRWASSETKKTELNGILHCSKTSSHQCPWYWRAMWRYKCVEVNRNWYEINNNLNKIKHSTDNDKIFSFLIHRLYLNAISDARIHDSSIFLLFYLKLGQSDFTL